MPLATYNAHETPRMHALHGRPLAPFSRRAAALTIDFAIAGTLFLLLVITVGNAVLRTGLIRPEHDINLHLNFFENWYSIVWLVGYFASTTYLGDGRTPGKRLMRIRIVSLVDERVSLWQAVERALGYGASALEFGFGFLQYFIHPNRRTVHDRIAETIVVDERVPAVARASLPRRAPPLAAKKPQAALGRTRRA
jgi:uncharacterized RDD family membrane protein YckC